MNTAQEAAAYMMLMSDYQVRVILKAAREDAGATHEEYRILRSKISAPPAIMALYGGDRVDEEDILPGMTGLGYVVYAEMKETWDRDRYRRLFVVLFGVTDTEAGKMADKIETQDPEGLKDKLKRMSQKLADTVLWHLYDVNTTKPDPDIAYEWMRFGKEMRELAKRAGYASVPFDNIQEIAKLMSASGAAKEQGDMIEDGDYVEVDTDRLANHLDAYSNFLKPEPLRSSEMGGWLTDLKKTAAKVVSAPAKLLSNPLISAVAKTVGGFVPGPLGMAIANAPRLANISSSITSSLLGVGSKKASPTTATPLDTTAPINALRADSSALAELNAKVDQAVELSKAAAAEMTAQVLDQSEKVAGLQAQMAVVSTTGEPLSWAR
jgi:hypothetical protein